jgi:hypothetical protein
MLLVHCGNNSDPKLFSLSTYKILTPLAQPYGRSGSALLPASGGHIKYVDGGKDGVPHVVSKFDATDVSSTTGVVFSSCVLWRHWSQPLILRHRCYNCLAKQNAFGSRWHVELANATLIQNPLQNRRWGVLLSVVNPLGKFILLVECRQARLFNIDESLRTERHK